MTTKSRAAMIRKIERRVRSKYIRRCWLCFILALLIGLAGGISLCKWGPLKSFADPSRNSPVVEATDEPTVTPEAGEPEESPEPSEAPEAAPEATEAADAAAAETSEPDAEATPAVTAAPTPTATPEPTASFEPIVISTTSEAVAEATPAADADASVAIAQAGDDGEADAPADEGAAAPDEDEADVAAPVPTPAVLVDADGNVLGTIDHPIPMGEVYQFNTEIVQGGTPRYAVSMSEYDTITLSASVQDYLKPEYFAEKYSTKYKLQGNEAGAALALTLDNSTGSQIVNPQDAVLICFESESGVIAQGYQLMNAEIAGDYGVPLEAGTEQVYYKRFAYTTDPEMDFLTVTYYVGGEAVKVYFSLEPIAAEGEDAAPEQDGGEATYATLETGDRGDAVQALQERLVELGYLEGDADGIFGGMTQSAISAAQEKGGMEATGVADSDFQTYIFSEDAVAAGD